MNRYQKIICAISAATVLIMIIAAVWIFMMCKLEGQYRERIAHQQMQIEYYGRLMNERESKIHELEKEIAADRK